MKYTVSISMKIYVGDRLLGEVFYSREFDDSTTPHEAGFQIVKDQADQWAEELTKKWTKQQPAPTLQPKISTKPVVRTVEDITKVFPQDLVSLLNFEDAGGNVLVKPKQYLGTDIFKKVSAIVKEFNGVYYSSGKLSHWRIPKNKALPQKIGFIDEPEILDFDPLDLTEHEGWKAKKLDDGSYAKGSLNWGWDFADKFSGTVIEALKKGSLEIDRYEFTLNPSGNIVQVRRKK